MNDFLSESELLDFSSHAIRDVVKNKGWLKLDDYNKIKKIYDFVRDEIKFGYNTDDAISASQVLCDGLGQCNTKGILFMALLRSVGIQCRFHGFTICKQLQKGAISGLWYVFSPKEIVHSWVEVLYNNKWYNLEGFILDLEYLTSLQRKFSSCTDNFCGYGVATKSFKKPEIYWNECDTYIQKEGIIQDLGIYSTPDDFFKIHRQKLNAFKRFVFRNITRHSMNRNVKRVRENLSGH